MDKKKILIIDDEPTILMTMKDRLELEGYAVVTATDGTSGIETAKNNNPDAIVLDIMLPDMSGHDVCRILKNEAGINAAVIMATSKIDAIDAGKARDSGADDFTVKTTDYEPLLGCIKKVFS